MRHRRIRKEDAKRARVSASSLCGWREGEGEKPQSVIPVCCAREVGAARGMFSHCGRKLTCSDVRLIEERDSCESRWRFAALAEDDQLRMNLAHTMRSHGRAQRLQHPRSALRWSRRVMEPSKVEQHMRAVSSRRWRQQARWWCTVYSGRR